MKALLAVLALLAITATTSEGGQAQEAPSTAAAVAEAEGKSVWAVRVSLASLLVSSLVAIYSYRKDRRARRQSVNDDYWLRKIIGPTAIEPLIALVLDSTSKLPHPTSENLEALAQTSRSFANDYQQKHREMVVKLMVLSVLDHDLYANVLTIFDVVEDKIVEYCCDVEVACGAGKVEQAASARHLAQIDLTTTLNACLKCVHTYQQKMA